MGREYGRKPVLVTGWATALPLPVIPVFAPNWAWITVGNVLLGINQGLTWSMAINDQIGTRSTPTKQSSPSKIYSGQIDTGQSRYKRCTSPLDSCPRSGQPWCHTRLPSEKPSLER